LIPFYKDRLEYIDSQLELYSHLNDKDSEKEKEYLQKIKQNIEKDKIKEVKALNKLAKNIYKLWKDIQEERKKSNCQKTPYCLKVYQGAESDDILFNIIKDNKPLDEKELNA
jgi:hypothetical protein